MNTADLNRKFERIGARLKIVDAPKQGWRVQSSLSLDIGNDRQGEYFEIKKPAVESPPIDVLDVQPRDRHLLLLIRENGDKNKFLCGHDERHWFVAGIPESAPVGTVRQAKESLQPVAVRAAVARKGLSGKQRNRRKNAAFVRQGEWFFLPAPDINVDRKRVLTNEPLSRGMGSKPHWVDYAYRTGGELVYVCNRYRSGVFYTQYRAILAKNPKAQNWNWHPMRLNAAVYVRGRVRHSDHATIMLNGWHEVIMNTESESKAMRHVRFLD